MGSRKLKPKIEKTAAWIELPADVTANILKRLGVKEILESAQKVCSTWRRVCCDDPSMWRVIELGYPHRLMHKYSIMCRDAVDRSQGQLLHLTLSYFGDDELINYAADRSSQLKRLTLECCYLISGKGLAEAAKKLPHLEELHLIFPHLVEASNIESIGISCPKLKSFVLFHMPNNQVPPNIKECALAIVKSMPNLDHLRLFKHWNLLNIKMLID